MLDSIAKNGSFATTNRKSSLGFFMQEGERRAMFLICLGLLASGAWEPSTKETWAQGPFLSCNSTLFAILLGQSQGNRRTNKLLLFLTYNKKFAAQKKICFVCFQLFFISVMTCFSSVWQMVFRIFGVSQGLRNRGLSLLLPASHESTVKSCPVRGHTLGSFMHLIHTITPLGYRAIWGSFNVFSHFMQ